MICPICKREIPADTKFCPYCGHPVEDIPQTEPVSPASPVPPAPAKKKFPVWATILIVILALIVVAAGVYFGTYSSAKSAAEKGDFEKASRMLLIPSLTKNHDENLLNYIEAGNLYAEGKYQEAADAFAPLAQNDYLNAKELQEESIYKYKESQYNEAVEQLDDGLVSGYLSIISLADDGFQPAIDGLDDANKKAYETAVDLYHEGDTEAAGGFFAELDNYERSADYYTLIQRNDCEALKKLIGFEDTNEVIVSTNSLANKFLLGNWITADNEYHMTFSENDDGSYHVAFNIPSLNLDNSYYRIQDSVYFKYDKSIKISEHPDGDFERLDVFKFTVIDVDTVDIYNYKDDLTYRVYRQ